MPPAVEIPFLLRPRQPGLKLCLKATTPKEVQDMSTVSRAPRHTLVPAVASTRGCRSGNKVSSGTFDWYRSNCGTEIAGPGLIASHSSPFGGVLLLSTGLCQQYVIYLRVGSRRAEYNFFAYMLVDS